MCAVAKTGRINSIDALRGATLLGILLVHVNGGFGYQFDTASFSLYEKGLRGVIYILLSNRCAPIFSMLFGVSFYLILRNPSYNSSKFLWRCILLICIGLFNKLFYTYDALMWYGLWGIMLLPMRNTPPRNILVIFAVVFIASCFLSELHIGSRLFGPEPPMPRYSGTSNLTDVLEYPLTQSVVDYLRIVCDSGILGTYAYFIFGYWIARSGIIESLERYSTFKNLVLTGAPYFILLILWSITLYFSIESAVLDMILRLKSITGALFYAAAFLWLYYKFPKIFNPLRAYGKCGLTNYSMQSIIGVVLMATLFIPKEVDFLMIVIVFLIFYILQVILSALWLKYFTNGPMEYVWRSMTNLRFKSPLVSKNK